MDAINRLTRSRNFRLNGTYLPLMVLGLVLVTGAPLAGPSRASSEGPPAREPREPGLAEVTELFRRRLPAAYRARAPRLARALLNSARRHRLSPSLLLGVIATESSFDPRARSAQGAVGLMQLKRATALEVARRARLPLSDLTDPEQNICLGVAYLAGLRDRYLYSRWYLAAYNLGPTRLRRRLSESPRTGTAAGYVEKIHGHARLLRAPGTL